MLTPSTLASHLEQVMKVLIPSIIGISYQLSQHRSSVNRPDKDQQFQMKQSSIGLIGALKDFLPLLAQPKIAIIATTSRSDVYHHLQETMNQLEISPNLPHDIKRGLSLVAFGFEALVDCHPNEEPVLLSTLIQSFESLGRAIGPAFVRNTSNLIAEIRIQTIALLADFRLVGTEKSLEHALQILAQFTKQQIELLQK